MLIELLILGGYGQFVWPAFILAFSMYSYLYFRTKAELKKQEKIYLTEFPELKNSKIEFSKRKKITKEALSIN
tara:strand:- start:5422 stop:5640 length:219 start_codon:yes stop_codon:yes gene_type:complete